MVESVFLSRDIDIKQLQPTLYFFTNEISMCVVFVKLYFFNVFFIDLQPRGHLFFFLIWQIYTVQILYSLQSQIAEQVVHGALDLVGTWT